MRLVINRVLHGRQRFVSPFQGLAIQWRLNLGRCPRLNMSGPYGAEAMITNKRGHEPG